ncbi:hypothetical protein [Paenibacillus sp. GCM10023250]|uniref:hypothetical protein n=1 Tax=Paenibacillus sp. GCM10023250 TaxID=3252648 RepID=UPI003607955D
MAPFIVLIVSFALFRLLGYAGAPYFADWQHALQAAVSAMLLLAASAHWGKRRADLVRMVPRRLPFAEAAVTATGLLELAGAAALHVPSLSSYAAAGLIALFVVLFPANVKAARERLTIGGRPVPGLAVRAAMQLIFIAAALLAGPIVL